MRKISEEVKLNKKLTTILSAGVILLLLVKLGFASDFTRIEMFPKHIGIFTSVKKQQFMAFGYKADGSTVNITNQVSWKSSDASVVQIDDNGLAVLTDTGIQAVIAGTKIGKLTVSCSYPKTGTGAPGPNFLLLKPSRRPR